LPSSEKVSVGQVVQLLFEACHYYPGRQELHTPVVILHTAHPLIVQFVQVFWTPALQKPVWHGTQALFPACQSLPGWQPVHIPSFWSQVAQLVFKEVQLAQTLLFPVVW